MTIRVQDQLHEFATALLERRGAVVDWPAADANGHALLPDEVASSVGAEGEMVGLSCEPGGNGLSVNLSTDFLEWAGRLLEAEPKVGVFRVGEMYLKRKELDEGIRRAFTWLNAKVTMRGAREIAVEYHTWWFYGTISSEERWETQLDVSLNATSGCQVEMPSPLRLWELETRPGNAAVPQSTYARAVFFAGRRLIQLASAFLTRMDTRLERDRKRLHDYYGALLRETGRAKTRRQVVADPEQIAARKRAVELELRRKLAELDERYAMEASIEPVVLVRTEVRVLAVDLHVFRKLARRDHTVYWNPLIKRFEPIACSRCNEATFAVAFTNQSVEPLCPACSTASGS
jgi:hypothetical protein